MWLSNQCEVTCKMTHQAVKRRKSSCDVVVVQLCSIIYWTRLDVLHKLLDTPLPISIFQRPGAPDWGGGQGLRAELTQLKEEQKDGWTPSMIYQMLSCWKSLRDDSKGKPWRRLPCANMCGLLPSSICNVRFQ